MLVCPRSCSTSRTSQGHGKKRIRSHRNWRKALAGLRSVKRPKEKGARTLPNCGISTIVNIRVGKHAKPHTENSENSADAEMFQTTKLKADKQIGKEKRERRNIGNQQKSLQTNENGPMPLKIMKPLAAVMNPLPF